MGFGAIIAVGENNILMPERLLQCITEVRVEQSLDDMTQFAIRFEEDISGGEPVIMKEAELKCEQMITIAVEERGKIKCLVRGPITDMKCSVKLGGPGSWFEVHGQDRRIELDRQCLERAWAKKASQAVQSILKNEAGVTVLSRKFEIDIDDTQINYGGTKEGGQPVTPTLNQCTTDLKFIRKVAAECNLHFWIGYECTQKGQSLDVTETAKLKASPPRPVDGKTEPVSPAQVKLTSNVPVALRVNVEKERCQNVTAFELTMNPERPNRYSRKAMNDRKAKIEAVPAGDRQPTIIKGGRRLAGCNKERDVRITAAGNPEEVKCKADSALTAAGWFLQATANTTAHMLGGVLLPHDVIDVEGLGTTHSGPYQVKAVTHVINAADHFMDVQLRRNAIGGG